MIIAGTDLETTGFLEPDHRIIEVAILRYDYDPATQLVKPLDTYVQRIDPERNIDKKAQEVHGIALTDLYGKPKWQDVAPTIRDILDGCDVVVGHNLLEFDAPFLLQEFDRVGVSHPDFVPFDTMQEGRWACPFGKVPNLGELCFASGVPYVTSLAHAAEYDVAVMMDCFFYGLRRGVFTLST